MRDTLSLERKLKMHEAREAILNRIGSETFSVINLDHFLQATVTEVGKMMGVDRCDVITLTPENHFRITHEYRADNEGELPSLQGVETSAVGLYAIAPGPRAWHWERGASP